MKSFWVPYLVLAVALLATALVTGYVADSTRLRERLGFQKSAESIEGHLQTKMASYVTILRATRGLFSASDRVSSQEFADFFRELRLTDQFHGVLGIGLSKRIRPGQLEKVVAERRADGLPGFSVWPRVEGVEEHAIYFLEPQGRRNFSAMGYNMFSDPVRHDAMITARDTGSPTLSGRVILVQELDEVRQPGFLLYLPVYGPGSQPRTLAERRERLEGFVYLPFRAGDLLRTVASARQLRDVSYAIFDGGGTRPDDLLYKSSNFDDSQARGGRFRSVSYVAIARRTWTLVCVSTEAFDRNSDQHFAPITGWAGALVSLLLFGATLAQARARLHAERTSEELDDAREEAETANRLKDQFLATVSHELRTPLNAISGWTQLLLDNDSLDAETRKGLAVIDRNAHAQAVLVEELLDVSRIISGRLRLQVERMDLIRVVEDALETVQPAAEARQIMIERVYCADSAPMLGDPGRLRQVAWNLLSNSIKFSPIGSSVKVFVEPCALGLELRVADRGQGIAADFLPYVFTAFRQADSSSARRYGGLGLGLAIVKQLVELHGGTVSVASEGEGRGATLAVQLPIRAVEEAASTPPTPAVPSGPGLEHALQGASVLVVDDEEDSRSFMKRALEQKGASVIVAESAGAALQALKSAKVDVLVSDLGMPEEDGFSLVRSVRALDRTPRLPAIAVSAYATEADRARAKNAGFDQHLAKPVDPVVLQRAVARWSSPRE